MKELKRFERLFDRLIEQTLAYIDCIDDVAAYAIIPVDSNVNFLGERVNKINIGSLLRHYIIAESHFFEHLAKAEDGQIIHPPENTAILDGLRDGTPLIEAYRTIYKQAKMHLASLSKADLDKRTSFADRHYTIIGFLWTLLGHHSFHLGQIDLLMRQQNIKPPEYMEWPAVEEILG